MSGRKGKKGQCMYFQDGDTCDSPEEAEVAGGKLSLRPQCG